MDPHFKHLKIETQDPGSQNSSQDVRTLLEYLYLDVKVRSPREVPFPFTIYNYRFNN